MKKNHLLLCLPALVLAGALATLNFGCGKKTASSAGGNSAGDSSASAVAAITPAVPVGKTSFTEVTSQLDPGGNFYLYLGTAQWLDGLSAKVGAWRQKFTAMPGLKPDDAANINKMFDLATRLIQDSGIEDVSGVGLSSVEIEKGVYRNKSLLHHYPGKGDGFLWQLIGKAPHPLTGLDLLPADTALAVFSDTDLPVLWTVAQKEIARSGLPQAQMWMKQFPVQFEQRTQIKWDDLLHSLGGEFGLVLTLDPSNNIPMPLPGGAVVIPSPGLLLALKVNDDTIFNRIDDALASNPQVISVTKPGLEMRTMPVPVPFIGELRPSTASSGGYLFIASSDELINEALAVKSGQTSGLKTTDAFKHLAQGLPEQGNQFCFLSQRFAETLIRAQQQAMASSASAQPQMAQWLQSIVHNRPAFTYSVGVNTPDGCLTIGNSSQSYANTVLLPAVAVPAMLAAIAIPNFARARAQAAGQARPATVSQQNACINNLRQLDAAKNEWALEKGKKNGDTPAKEDLLPFLRRWPVCPAGGTYTIGPLGEQPTCSIPGHQLP